MALFGHPRLSLTPLTPSGPDPDPHPTSCWGTHQPSYGTAVCDVGFERPSTRAQTLPTQNIPPQIQLNPALKRRDTQEDANTKKANATKPLQVVTGEFVACVLVVTVPLLGLVDSNKYYPSRVCLAVYQRKDPQHRTVYSSLKTHLHRLKADLGNLSLWASSLPTSKTILF